MPPFIFIYLKNGFLNQTEDSLSVERKGGKKRKSDSCNLIESLKEKKSKKIFCFVLLLC
jgi:hypothetical protein